MTNSYTLRKDGYANGIWRRDEYLKSMLNSTDTAARCKSESAIVSGREESEEAPRYLPQWRLETETAVVT